MGAFGEGMQANDTALDAIGCAGLSCGEPRKQKKTLYDLRNGKKTIESLFVSENGWIKRDAQAVLGLAEYLLDEGFDLGTVRAMVMKAIKNQLSIGQLDRWVEIERRKASLLRFRDRMNGKKVPQELLDEDNEGLFSRMARTLG